MTKPQFILASSSPRRLALLCDIGIKPDCVVAADIDETPKRAELPRTYAARLALQKLHVVAAQEPDGIILAADTVVACGRRILPKAETDDQVRECLKLLSGRRHHVYTAVAMRLKGDKISQRIADSAVSFQRLTSADIEDYVKCGEGVGKAGGYAIQGRAAAHIRFISGSYSNIVGLPLFDVSQMLRGLASPCNQWPNLRLHIARIARNHRSRNFGPFAASVAPTSTLAVGLAKNIGSQPTSPQVRLRNPTKALKSIDFCPAAIRNTLVFLRNI